MNFKTNLATFLAILRAAARTGRKKIDGEAQDGYSASMKTTPHLIAAIDSGDLSAISDLEIPDQPAIVLLIKDQAFCRLNCLESGSPTAKVVNDTVVRISPSPGIRNGFQITCTTVDDANAIADALQDLIDGVYPSLFDAK